MGGMDAEEVLREGERAIEALGVLLGEAEDGWFWGREKPGLFDASVFAYTHLILYGDEMGWWGVGQGRRLVKALRGREELVRHRERVLREYYDGER